MPGDYYNDFDPFAAGWLRELIKDGLIPDGEVDQRSVLDVRPADLRGFTRCHFFAGIGGWARALRLAGREDSRPGWTASLPCQPLSSAGLQQGHADERHLWPAFHDLVAECRPAEILGEQVASADGREWFSGIRADLEDMGYACGGADLCAAGVGAPHIRQRLFWVANAQNGDGRRGERGAKAGTGPDGIGGRRSASSSAAGGLADPDGGDTSPEGLQRGGQHGQQPQDGRAGGQLVDAQQSRLEGHARHVGDGHEPGRLGAPSPGPASAAGEPSQGLGDAQSRGRGEQRHAAFTGSSGHADGAVSDPWRSVLIHCADGKYRRIPADETGNPEPRLFPLVNGFPNRMGALRGAGNAINPYIAAEFIRACDQALKEMA